MTGRIHLSRPDVTAVEEAYVLAALRSGWVAPAGPDLDAFEAELAARVGVIHALALSSGTAALHLGLLGLGAGPGSAVIVPSLTFAASANAVVYTGAEPVFVDSLPDGTVDPELVLYAADRQLAGGQRLAAVMAVDLFGRCAAYEDLLPELERRGIPVLEDAAEALGATRHGRAAGSFGAAAALSFNGNKILTTSGGGMLLSDDADLVRRARYLASQARQPVDHYEHTEVGYNYRLSNVLAALGRAQLSRLDAMVARRREIREMYVQSLDGLPGVRVLGRGPAGARPRPGYGAGPGTSAADAGDSCWLTCLVLDPSLQSETPADVVADLAAEGIEARRLWKPMHLQPAYAGRQAVTTGAAERLFQTGVALPSGSALRDEEVERVVKVLFASLTRR